MPKQKSQQPKQKQKKKKPKYEEWNVSPVLSQMKVGWHVATYDFCHKALFTYIVDDKKLMFVEDGKKYFIPDEIMAQTLGTEKIKLAEGINRFLKAHLSKQ